MNGGISKAIESASPGSTEDNDTEELLSHSEPVQYIASLPDLFCWSYVVHDEDGASCIIDVNGD